MLSAWLNSHHGRIISRKPVGLSVGHKVFLWHPPIVLTRSLMPALSATAPEWNGLSYASLEASYAQYSWVSLPFKIERRLLMPCVWLGTDIRNAMNTPCIFLMHIFMCYAFLTGTKNLTRHLHLMNTQLLLDVTPFWFVVLRLRWQEVLSQTPVADNTYGAVKKRALFLVSLHICHFI